MAHQIRYKRVNEQIPIEFDFNEDLLSTDDVKAIGGGSSTDVTAIDSAGADQSSAIVGTKTVDTDKLTAIMKAGVDGEDYTVTFAVEGDGSGEIFEKVLELRVREELTVYSKDA